MMAKQKRETVPSISQEEIKKTFLDEAIKLSANRKDAASLAEEAYKDFQRHLMSLC